MVEYTPIKSCNYFVGPIPLSLLAYRSRAILRDEVNKSINNSCTLDAPLTIFAILSYTCTSQESWDYIGSSRMVYDMQQNVFPNARDNGKTVSYMYMYWV